MVSAREFGMPIAAMSAGFAFASISALGAARSRPANGVTTGVPKRRAMRADKVEAPATLTCCPSTARNASSKRSHAPGMRSPGAAFTSGASSGSLAKCVAMDAGSQSRSNSSRKRSVAFMSIGSKVFDSVTLRTCVWLLRERLTCSPCDTASQPVTGPCSVTSDTVRRYTGTSCTVATCSTPGVARRARYSQTVRQSQRDIRVRDLRSRLQALHIFVWRFAACMPTQLRRRETILFVKRRVEPAHALKARCERELRHRQFGFLQQFLCKQEPLGLRNLDRCHAETIAQYAPDLSARQAYVTRERVAGAGVERSGLQVREYRAGERRIEIG